MKKDRRDFIRITTMGATSLALTKTTASRAGWPSSGTMQINPDIDNMRVVGLVDTAMMKSIPSNMSFETQNAAVNWPRVQANMDAMAMALAQKGTADEAWRTIFRSSRDWASTVVAVKVNAGESKNTARLAVLQKFSNLFTGWGVKPENFIVYDYHTRMGSGGDSRAAAATIFRSSFSTTDKSKVLGVVSGLAGDSDDLLGGWKDGKLGNGSTRRCPAKLVDGTVDILIDIANNKGHMMFGKATLCMKNHYGTWEPDPQHTDLNNLIFNMNKGDPIIGGNPARQQLCFVDSMFCNKANITGTPELMPCYFVMGTFAPAVDYQTVKKIREEISKLSHDSATINSYLTAWGYTANDPEWVLVQPASVTTPSGTDGGDTSGSGGNAGGSSGTRPGNAKGGGPSGAGENHAGDASGPSDASGGASRGSGGGGSKGLGGGRSGSGDNSASESLESDGRQGSGGTRSGGTTVTGGGTDRGGDDGSNEPPASSAFGAAGMQDGGGASGANAPASDTGCACEVGGARLGTRGLGAGLVIGAVVAGQLGRLIARRAKVAGGTADAGVSNHSVTAISVAQKDDDPDLPIERPSSESSQTQSKRVP